jgi:uncharacterized protein (DUF3820 family)
MHDRNELIQIANTPMPFGKYKGFLLIDLPETYVVWFYNQGLPDGHIGQLLGLLYEIKLNGLEELVRPFIKYDGQSNRPHMTQKGQPLHQ